MSTQSNSSRAESGGQVTKFRTSLASVREAGVSAQGPHEVLRCLSLHASPSGAPQNYAVATSWSHRSVVAVGSAQPDRIVGFGQNLRTLHVDGADVESVPLVDGRMQRHRLSMDAGSTHEIEEQNDVKLSRAWKALIAEAQLGGLLGALETTREFVTAREQFGRRLSEQQAVSHRYVDVYCEVELLRSATELMIDCVGDYDAGWIEIASAIALQAPDLIRRVVHLHGAIGLTSEAPIGRHLMQALVLRTMAEPAVGRPRELLATHHHVRSPAVLAGRKR